jgi:hypothetical protein
MARTLVLTCVCGLLLSSGVAGDGPPLSQKRTEAEAELQLLLRTYGDNHPKVLEARVRLDQLRKAEADADVSITKGLLVVLTKHQTDATLRGAQVKTLGGRSFVVGTEVAGGPNITKARFPGRTVWIPVDEITQMIEVDDAKEGKDGK